MVIEMRDRVVLECDFFLHCVVFVIVVVGVHGVVLVAFDDFFGVGLVEVDVLLIFRVRCMDLTTF